MQRTRKGMMAHCEMHRECLIIRDGDAISKSWTRSTVLKRMLALQMLETFSGLAIGQMVAERATLVMRMSEIEDWAIVAASHKTGWLPPLPQWFCPHLLTPRLTTSPAG